MKTEPRDVTFYSPRAIEILRAEEATTPLPVRIKMDPAIRRNGQLTLTRTCSSHKADRRRIKKQEQVFSRLVLHRAADLFIDPIQAAARFADNN